MSTGSLVTLARFIFPHEAHVFMDLLAFRGLAAFIADEQLITMQWMWETALGGDVCGVSIAVSISKIPVPPAAVKNHCALYWYVQ
ncbi:hypothetical protein ACUN8C_00830 [Kushneria sp. Sum13]|uniref:hypothetical protein n=1 Tax=Kushneria sp. Sum13 TaxID=3459196 RepID=UPI00404605DB